MNDPAPETICSRLERLRTEMFGDRGKSRMARQLGIRPSTYDRYERDRVPPADLLVKISEVANVTLDWLITGEGPRRPPQQLDREGEELTRRFEEAIAVDTSLRPVARAFLQWLDDRRHHPESTPQRFDLPSDVAAGTAATGQTIVDTSESGFSRGREPGSGHSPAQSGGGEPGGESDQSSLPATPSTSGPSPEPGRPEVGPAAAGESDPSEGMIRRITPETVVPVVGRTSAGPAGFWSDLGYLSASDRDAMVARVLEQGDVRTEPLTRAVEKESSDLASVPSAALVQVGGGGEALEFVLARELKRQFPDAVAWRIDGDSMEPRYSQGDLVVTSRSATAVEGQPCIARQKGQIGVNCKVYHREGDQIVLIPINPRIEVQRLRLSDLESATRVLFVIRR